MSRISILVGAILMVLVVVVAANTFGQKSGDSSIARANNSADAKANETEETTVREQWEYLIVAGGHTNLSPSGNPSMRKEPNSPFSRENFPLQQNMDKLGARGWELISVTGNPADPTYYFKRRK